MNATKDEMLGMHIWTENDYILGGCKDSFSRLYSIGNKGDRK